MRAPRIARRTSVPNLVRSLNQVREFRSTARSLRDSQAWFKLRSRFVVQDLGEVLVAASGKADDHQLAAAVESASSDDLLLIAYLGDDVLPSPRQVAQYVGELLADPPAGSLKPPHVRKQGADEGLAARLSDYVARSEQWKPPWRRIGSADVWGGTALM